jgi:hypothetical protein
LRAYGKWKGHPGDYPLLDRLFGREGGLDDSDETDLLFDNSAVEMLDQALRKLWKRRKVRPGTVTDELNRHRVMHGTAHGWDTRENAVRAVLLVAAAARVAGPLLGPRTS